MKDIISNLFEAIFITNVRCLSNCLLQTQVRLLHLLVVLKLETFDNQYSINAVEHSNWWIKLLLQVFMRIYDVCATSKQIPVYLLWRKCKTNCQTDTPSKVYVIFFLSVDFYPGLCIQGDIDKSSWFVLC